MELQLQWLVKCRVNVNTGFAGDMGSVFTNDTMQEAQNILFPYGYGTKEILDAVLSHFEQFND
jgi:hypothetical protein